jgi:hypothetical protein
MKQIKRIIIKQTHDAETDERYFELVYKLRETITNLDVSPPIYRQAPRFNLHLEIDYHYPVDIDFITIPRFCPKLQSLILTQYYGIPPLPPSKKLMVCNNLKHLDLRLIEFLPHYVTFITSCIPPTIDHFKLLLWDDENNWICSGFAETMLVDQFLAHLSKIKDKEFSLRRRTQPKTHFANSIRGRREKMITKANIRLFSHTSEYVQRRLEFKFRENKYFDFSQTFYENNESLEDIPTNDIENLAMINNIKITTWSNIGLLQFLRYIVKRCTRLSRIFVDDRIIFAPIAMRIDKEEEMNLPLGYVTTPTEENILFASYSRIPLHESFLQSISQMFPKIEAVRIAGCYFEEPIIRIDLGGLEHLRRFEPDPRHIYRKESVLFAVHLERYGTVNYFFKRLIQGLQETMGLFELISRAKAGRRKRLVL